MPEEEEDVQEEQPKPRPKGKKKKIIILAALVLVLAGGGGAGAFFFMNKGAGPENEAGADLAGEHAQAEPEEGGHGDGGGGHGETAEPGAADASLPADTYKFESPFFVALSDPNQHRQLQFVLALELTDPKHKDEIVRRLHRFRDAVYTELSSRTEAEVISREGMERIKRDLTRRFDGLLGREGAIKAVYFSDILTGMS